MYPSVELRLLRYAIAVAEELHFSRAAERLHLAQPSLSKQIRDLEDQVGTKLFERDKRSVALTEAGKAFVEEARAALFHSQRAIRFAKATNEHFKFALGYSPYVNPASLATLRVVLGRQFPKLDISFVSAYSYAQLRRIELGEVDAGLVVLPVDGKDLRVEPVFEEPLIAALPANHRLANRKLVPLSELSGEPFICISRTLHPDYYKYLFEACSKEGLEVSSFHEVTTFPEALSLIADGIGITLIRPFCEQFSCPGIRFRGTAPSLVSRTGIVYRSNSNQDVVRSIIAALGKKRPTRTPAVSRMRDVAAV